MRPGGAGSSGGGSGNADGRRRQEIARELLALDLNTLTPIEALNTLYQFTEKGERQ